MAGRKSGSRNMERHRELHSMSFGGKEGHEAGGFWQGAGVEWLWQGVGWPLAGWGYFW